MTNLTRVSVVILTSAASLLIIIHAQVDVLKIGAIFEQKRVVGPFLFAIEEINKDSNVLPNTVLQAIVNVTNPIDAFDNLQAAQYQISQGVVAIIGPMMSTDVKYTQPFLSGFHIPQIAPVATDPTFSSIPANFPFLIRMSPSDTVQCKALAGLLQYYNWTQFALLTSKDDYAKFPCLIRMSPSDTVQCKALAGLLQYYNWTQFALLTSKDDYGINGVLALKDEAYKRGWLVVAHEHFEPVPDPSTLDIKSKLKWIRQTGTRIVVLNCYKKYSRQVIKQAGELGMTEDWVWIVTDAQTELDWQTLGNDFDVNQFYGVIGTRLAFGEGSIYEDVARRWQMQTNDDFDVATGKAYDSVLALAWALHLMILDGFDVKGEELGFEFDEGAVKPWSYGAELMKYIKEVETSGVMNNVKFQEDGSPQFQEYDIVNLGRTGFVDVGKWSPSQGIVMFPDKPVLWLSQSLVTPRDRASTVENTSIRVITVIEPPFVNKEVTDTGAVVFTGLCIELLNRLQQDMKFKYTIDVIPGNVYGSWDMFNQEWNGMIQHLNDRKADLAVGPLTVSSKRQTVVDFTQPFLHLGLSILIKNSVNQDYKVFSFLKPFNVNLWVAIVVSTLFIGFFLWLHSTFSPRGYHGRIAQSRDPDGVMEDHLSTRDCLRFFESTWSSFSYTAGQGADISHPESASGRVVVAFWWFAMLIISASYTANLASFLITDVFETPISSLEDLAAQNRIKYGCVRDSHTMMFFQMSRVETYAKMWAFMKSHDTLVDNVTEGIERAREGGFALISDSDVLEYHTFHRPCNSLTTVGRLFGKFGYGFALPKNSPYTQQFSVKILELRQKGFMKHLKEKWLQGVCAKITQGSAEASFSAGDVLVFHDMAGVFYAVIFGLALSLIVLLGELVWAAFKEKKAERVPSTIQGIKQRLLASWNGIRGRPTSPRYNSNPRGAKNWSIALEQVQKLLPPKDKEADRGKIGPQPNKNGLHELVDGEKSSSPYSTKPSSYI